MTEVVMKRLTDTAKCPKCGTDSRGGIDQLDRRPYVCFNGHEWVGTKLHVVPTEEPQKKPGLMSKLKGVFKR